VYVYYLTSEKWDIAQQHPVVEVIVSFARRKGTIQYYFICKIELSVITIFFRSALLYYFRVTIQNFKIVLKAKIRLKLLLHLCSISHLLKYISF